VYGWIGAGAIALLAFSFTFSIPLFGLGRTIVVDASTVFAASVINLIIATLEKQNLLILLACVLCGLLLGAAGGLYYKHRAAESVRITFNRQYISLMEDYRIRVVFGSILAAVLVTMFFAKMRMAEVAPEKFWHGFYEAWTASLVFFAVLGLAGTVVSLYRPEKEAFDTKVRILCGGSVGSEVDYLAAMITKFGYYSESVTRIYTFKAWDSVRQAYEIEISQHTVNKSYFGGDASNSGGFRIKPDPFTPPLDPVGTLIEVRVGDRLIRSAEHIPVGGLDIDWPIELNRGGETPTLVRHKMLYGANTDHTFRPPRFTKILHTNLVSEIPGAIIDFSGRVYNKSTTDFLRPGLGDEMPITGTVEASKTCAITPPQKNCPPNEVAVTLNFQPPRW
jgi:hypothetical protein